MTDVPPEALTTSFPTVRVACIAVSAEGDDSSMPVLRQGYRQDSATMRPLSVAAWQEGEQVTDHRIEKLAKMIDGLLNQYQRGEIDRATYDRLAQSIDKDIVRIRNGGK